MAAIKTADQQQKALQQLIGRLLQLGVLASSVVMLIGGGMYLVHSGNLHGGPYVFKEGAGTAYTSIGGVINGVFKGDSGAIIQMGVLLLIATPVARIIFSLIGFLREKDRLYVFISLLVLCVIIGSMLSGKA
jgi:uncharacterized membrane protein